MDAMLARNRIRLSLLATVVAATGAFVAAPVQAKPPPTISGGDDIACADPNGNVSATFTVAGKGRWAFADVDFVFNIGEPNEYEARDVRGWKVDRTEPVPVNDIVGAGANVAIRVTLVDRKGNGFGTDESTITTGDVDCP